MYSSLSEGRIRLVHVHPAAELSDPISCHLEYVNLSNAPQFEALSYVWGSPVGTIPIECMDSRLLITPNLQVALRRLRHVDHDRVFWIDAVCINQQDPLERNGQVKMMRQIYEKACEVLVWLGEQPVLSMTNADETTLTLSLAYKIAQHHIATSAPIFADVVDLPSLDEELSCLESIPEMAAQALHSLIAYPWFTRMWIIQEAAVNKNTMVVCGEDRIEWGKFENVVQIMSNRVESELRHVQMRDIRRCQALVSVKNIVHDVDFPEGDGRAVDVGDQQGRTSLSSLLAFSQLFAATDPRDKIYALLGLAHDVVAGNADLQPNYDLPVAEIYRKFARFIIKKERRLDILHRTGVRRSLAMPSWVPDWSVETNEGKLPFDGFDDWYPHSESDGEERGDQSHIILEETAEPDLLILHGKAFGRIKCAGPELVMRSGSSSFKDDFADVGPQWEKLAAREAGGAPDARKLRKYLETITARRQKRQGVNWKKDGFVTWYHQYGSKLFKAPTEELKYAEDGFWGEWKHCFRKSRLKRWLQSVVSCSKISSSQSSDSDSSATEDSDDWSYEAPPMEETVRECTNQVEEACYGRKFIVTSNGKMGLAPFRAEVGDLLVYFPGSSLPFVVRPKMDVDREELVYSLIGDSYEPKFDASKIMGDPEIAQEKFILA